MIRYRMHKGLWVSVIVVTSAFLIASFIAAAYNFSELSLADIQSNLSQYWREWCNTFIYAVVTSFFQIFLGLIMALLTYFYWARRGGQRAASGIVYFALLPYFVPIGPLGLILRNYANLHGMPLGGIWGWFLLCTLSVWQYFPFVFLLAYEQLLTIHPITWSALDVEGAGFKEAFSNILWPKAFQIIGAVFLLRLFWMYTKVDTIYYLFKDGDASSRFMHMQLYYRVASKSLDPGIASRSVIMVAAAILIAGIWALIVRARERMDALVSKNSGQMMMLQVKPEEEGSRRPFIPRNPFPVMAGRITVIMIIALLVGAPFLFLLSLAFLPNDALVRVSADNLLKAWMAFLPSNWLKPDIARWLFQSVVLGAASGLVYTIGMSIVAYLLVREKKLSKIGSEKVLRWIPLCVYAIPLIAIALPLSLMAQKLVWSSQLGYYIKLLLLQGIYLWPFCLWMAFRQLSSIRQRPELAALSEGASFLIVMKIAVIPQFFRRAIALFLLVFAISMNELIFATNLLNNNDYYTIPIALIHAFDSLSEGNSPAKLFVITATTIIIGLFLFLSMWWTTKPEAQNRGNSYG